MKKSIFDIKLVNWLVFRDGYAINSTNGSWFYDRVERIIKIKNMLLRETLSNKATFIALQTTTIFKLVTIHPTKTHKISMHKFWDKTTCMVSVQDRHFIIHSCAPVRIVHSLINRAGNRRLIRRDIHIKIFPKF